MAAQNARDKNKSESENLKLENQKLLKLVEKMEFQAQQREVITTFIMDLKGRCDPLTNFLEYLYGVRFRG